MKLLEIVYDIKEKLGINTDDRAFDFPEAHILFVYEEARALVINKLLNRSGNTVDSQLYQTMRLPLERVDRSFCPEVPINCKIVRSKNKLPSALLYNHRHAIVDRVGGNDILSKKYKFIEYSSLSNVFGGAHSHKYVYAFELGGYLYLTSKNKMVDALGNVVVRAVFEQPSKIVEANACLDNCDNYPMPNRFHSMAVEIVVQQLSFKYQIPLDSDNNSDSDLKMLSNAKPKS